MSTRLNIRPDNLQEAVNWLSQELRTPPEGMLITGVQVQRQFDAYQQRFSVMIEFILEDRPQVQAESQKMQVVNKGKMNA